MIISAASYHVLHLIHIIYNQHSEYLYVPGLSFLFLHFHHQVLTSSKSLRMVQAAGPLATPIIAIIPECISWSVAVFWDNEGMTIFCILLTYDVLIKAANTGSMYCWPSMSFLTLHGLFVGRSLYILDQLSCFPCTHVGAHRTFLPVNLCSLLYCLLPEHHFLDEVLLCVFVSHSASENTANFVVFAPC